MQAQELYGVHTHVQIVHQLHTPLIPALLHPWYTPYLELCNQGFGVLNASRISLMGSKVQVKVHWSMVEAAEAIFRVVPFVEGR